jgi:tetratricopeptide (TPR) repeat protein
MNGSSEQPGAEPPLAQLIALDVLQSTFRGVVVATKAKSLEPDFDAWVAQRSKHPSVVPRGDREGVFPYAATECIRAWTQAAASEIQDRDLRDLAILAIVIASMRTKVREQAIVSAEHLEAVWFWIDELVARLSTSTVATLTVSRSAQGFLAVPLCSLLVDGRIDELWRFHFWLPDGQRPDLSKGWGIHSHQAFAQSWILAGKGEDVQYQSQTVSSREEASHAVFSLAWTDASGSGSTYKTHQTESMVVNTGSYVRVKEATREIHQSNSTYTVPAATFHSTTVDANAIHATLFVFDSKRGFVQDAPVLGPAEQESSTQIREAAGTTALEITEMTTILRALEKVLPEAEAYLLSSNLEDALQSYERALHLSRKLKHVSAAAGQQVEIRSMIAGIYRRFGRYETARDIMQELLQVIEPMSHQYMTIAGEMSVIYRHMDDLEQAKVMAQTQYDTAKGMGDVKHICHAAGTLGVLNYQQYLRDNDEVLLDTAILQLEERIDMARKICEDVTERNSTLTRLIVGLGRLANCRLLRGEAAAAVNLTREALTLSQELSDSTLISLSHLFHGRALAKDGQLQQAMAHFNTSDGCPPVVALCREPSEEHFGYLRELQEIGADFDCLDEHGYSALDYTEFNSVTPMGDVVAKGLRRSLRNHTDIDEEIARRRSESRLRKGYREIFQEELRPVLLKGLTASRTLPKLRHAYANALKKSQQRKDMFDCLKYMRYKDFLAFGRVPISSDFMPGTSTPLVRKFGDTTVGNGDGEEINFLVFFSYRWINTDTKTRATPDDENNTLFNRMQDALLMLLKMRPHLDQDRIGIWLVSS